MVVLFTRLLTPSNSGWVISHADNEHAFMFVCLFAYCNLKHKHENCTAIQFNFIRFGSLLNLHFRIRIQILYTNVVVVYQRAKCNRYWCIRVIYCLQGEWEWEWEIEFCWFCSHYFRSVLYLLPFWMTKKV